MPRNKKIEKEINHLFPGLSKKKVKRITVETSKVVSKTDPTKSEIWNCIREALKRLDASVAAKKSKKTVATGKSKSSKLSEKQKATVSKKVKTKKPSMVSRARRIGTGSRILTEGAIKKQEKSEKYWVENGGEKFTKPREPRSTKIFPNNNDLDNELGDQFEDNMGFAPMQQ